MNKFSMLAITLSLVLSFPTNLKADDASVKANLEKAQSLYKERTDLSKIDQAITLLVQAETEVKDSDLKYEVLVQLSKSLYYKGTHTSGDKLKITLHDDGYKKARQAIAVNADYADAFYFAAANLARWGEANGIVASLSKKKETVETLEAIYEKNSKDGNPGEAYEYNGADRALGRMYYKLPSFAGGSQAKSMKHLENAYQNAKGCALNIVYYAETVSAVDKGKAKSILDELLSKDANTYNPDRMPETLEDFALARKLRAELGN